jgi:hypothetical protein
MFTKAFLAAQTRLDIRKYGVIGFLRFVYYYFQWLIVRDDGRTCLHSSTFNEDALALDRALLINVEKTRNISFVSGLTKV